MARDEALATSSLAFGRFAAKEGSLRSLRGRLVASLWIYEWTSRKSQTMLKTDKKRQLLVNSDFLAQKEYDTRLDHCWFPPLSLSSPEERSAGSFPDQRLVIEPIVTCACMQWFFTQLSMVSICRQKWTQLLNQETWVKFLCCHPLIKALCAEFSLANAYYVVKRASNFSICIRGHVTVLILKLARLDYFFCHFTDQHLIFFK